MEYRKWWFRTMACRLLVQNFRNVHKSTNAPTRLARSPRYPQRGREGCSNCKETLENSRRPPHRPPYVPQSEAGDVWCLPPVWNLRAVIWFHFAISSLFLLPSPVTLPLLSFFFLCLLVHSPELFPENSSIFFVKRWAFLYGSCLAVRRRQLVGGMCSMLPYDTGICCYAFI